MAAKSLKCGECGKLLASVKEAQNHNELTGHVRFEETEEVIKFQKCKECGKPCRTDAERTLHTRFTGHTDYVETTHEEILNTEQQMSAARDEMMLDDDALVAKTAKKAAQAGSSSGAPAAAAGDAGEGSASNAGQNMVSPVVDEGLVTELEGMGFSRNKAVRAVYHSGGAGVEAAVNWVVDHEKDADIDEPLLVTQASEDAAAKLTPEERKQKAQDLIKAVKERREREERELAAHRERERIRAGKEMQAAKRKEDEGAMKRMVEQRQREKEEEARAREKIRAQLEEDRRARRRRLGLPEELTEEEKAREAEKAAAAAKAEAEKKKQVFGHVKPVTTLSRLRDALASMKKAHAAEEDKWRTAASTLQKYIANVMANPQEPKFRSIRTTNAAFQQRVAAATGGLQFLEIAGFQRSADGDSLVLEVGKENMDVLEGAATALHDMLTNPFFGVL